MRREATYLARFSIDSRLEDVERERRDKEVFASELGAILLT